MVGRELLTPLCPLGEDHQGRPEEMPELVMEGTWSNGRPVPRVLAHGKAMTMNKTKTSTPSIYIRTTTFLSCVTRSLGTSCILRGMIWDVLKVVTLLSTVLLSDITNATWTRGNDISIKDSGRQRIVDTLIWSSRHKKSCEKQGQKEELVPSWIWMRSRRYDAIRHRRRSETTQNQRLHQRISRVGLAAPRVIRRTRRRRIHEFSAVPHHLHLEIGYHPRSLERGMWVWSRRCRLPQARQHS